MNQCSEFFNRRIYWLIWILIGTLVPMSFLVFKPPFVFSMLFFGYVYVSAVTCERSDPFLDSNGKHLEIVKLMLVAPIYYYLGPSVTIKDDWLNPTDIFFTLELFGTYLVPYFIGLHFTYLDFIPELQKIECSPGGLRQMGWIQWLVISFVSLLVGVLGVFHVYMMISNDVWKFYCIGYGIGLFLFLFYLIINVMIRKTHVLHFHHYAIFGVMIPCTRFDHWISAICQGILSGIAVEGISRWGLSAIFVASH